MVFQRHRCESLVFNHWSGCISSASNCWFQVETRIKSVSGGERCVSQEQCLVHLRTAVNLHLYIKTLISSPPPPIASTDPYVIAPAAESTDTQSMNVIGNGTLTFKSCREMLFTYRSWNGSGQVRLTIAPPWACLRASSCSTDEMYKRLQSHATKAKGIISTTLSYIPQFYIFNLILKLNWFQWMLVRQGCNLTRNTNAGHNKLLGGQSGFLLVILEH